MKQSILWLIIILLLMGIIGQREYQFAKHQAELNTKIERLSNDLLNEKWMHLQTHKIHKSGVEMLRLKRIETTMSSGEFVNWITQITTGYELHEIAFENH